MQPTSLTPMRSRRLRSPSSTFRRSASAVQQRRCLPGWPAWEATDEEWRWAFDVNVFGIINGIRSFVPRMLDGGDDGHVVNTASVAGFVAAPLNGPYTASKQRRCQ